MLGSYRSDPGPFARPGPPPAPQLPLKFVCKACRADVDPEASRCGSCGAAIWMSGK